MDNSISSLHFHMAHLPMDRASKHTLSAQQSETSSPDSIYQIDSLQPYNPGHQAEHWPRFRSHQARTMTPLHQPSFPNPYFVESGQYEHNANHPHPHRHGQAAYLDSLYTSSRPDPAMAVPCMGSFTTEGKRQLPHEVHSDWTGAHSPVFKGDEVCEFPAHLQSVHAVHNISPSPLSTISSYESPESLALASPTMTIQTVDQLSPGSSEDGREDRPGPTPYSHLIFRALKDAKDNKLPLQGIYNWFERNTDKAKSSGSKGWQNSIRHNLSMNAGFEAVKEELGLGKKAVNFWRLTPEAIRHGHVQSTTRYRKQASARKALGANARAAQRQRTETKGGNPPKMATTRHPDTGHDEPNEIYQPPQMTLSPYPMDGHFSHPDPQVMPSYVPPALAPPIDNALQRYGMESVIGCINLSPTNNGSFYESMGAAPDNEAFTLRHAAHAGWYAPPSDHNIGMMTGSDVPADLHGGV